jgi:hypothetical protein
MWGKTQSDNNYNIIKDIFTDHCNYSSNEIVHTIDNKDKDQFVFGCHLKQGKPFQ